MNALDRAIQRLSIVARIWASARRATRRSTGTPRRRFRHSPDWSNILAFRADGGGVFPASAAAFSHLARRRCRRHRGTCLTSSGRRSRGRGHLVVQRRVHQRQQHATAGTKIVSGGDTGDGTQQPHHARIRQPQPQARSTRRSPAQGIRVASPALRPPPLEVHLRASPRGRKAARGTDPSAEESEDMKPAARAQLFTNLKAPNGTRPRGTGVQVGLAECLPPAAPGRQDLLEPPGRLPRAVDHCHRGGNLLRLQEEPVPD